MQKKQALQIMVAAGPYSTGDSLMFEALQDLMETVRRD
jgi:hypothetical protein